MLDSHGLTLLCVLCALLRPSGITEHRGTPAQILSGGSKNTFEGISNILQCLRYSIELEAFINQGHKLKFNSSHLCLILKNGGPDQKLGAQVSCARPAMRAHKTILIFFKEIQLSESTWRPFSELKHQFCLLCIFFFFSYLVLIQIL